jgi:hypothetical protein
MLVITPNITQNAILSTDFSFVKKNLNEKGLFRIFLKRSKYTKTQELRDENP